MMTNEKEGVFTHGIDVFRDGEFLTNQNDPSDVADILTMLEKLPRELFIVEEPDKAWDWDVLPMKFVWDCHLYEIDRYKNSEEKRK